MKEFFKALNDHTKATYNVLPLISLNKFSFGPPENFIDAYVTPDGSKVIVEVKDLETVNPGIWIHEWLLQDFDNYLVFEIPEDFRHDVQLYLKGKYSKLSRQAKELIRVNSALNYKKERASAEGKYEDTDARIRALDREPVLREKLERMLKVYISEDSELISPPTDKEVWVEKTTGGQ